jgi:cyclopropane fatty-acyl-phospholipid synthase-like methyltransferase
MKHLFSPFFNPVELIRAYHFHKKAGRYDRTVNDLELKLYSKILKNDMLHYGYFDDINPAPEFISIGLLEKAQHRYAKIIAEQILEKSLPVLDVGCGMGGLSNFLLSKGMNVEALTPDHNQIEYIERLDHGPICHHSGFEEFVTPKKFGTIITSESLQYLHLDSTVRRVDQVICEGGRWIITDVFTVSEKPLNKSGHLIVDFLCKIKEHGWKIVYERDITQQVLPTLKLLNMYVDRYLILLSQCAEEKFTYKKAWVFYLTKNIRQAIALKCRKEILTITPQIFSEEKNICCMFFKRIRFRVSEKRVKSNPCKYILFSTF